MDHALYTAMTGASQTMRSLAVTTNNLANVSTTGFRGELANAGSDPVEGAGWQTRVNATTPGSGVDTTQGAIRNTGRKLDVALRGDGWLAVQGPDGEAAYTRAGNLRVNAVGQLMTAAGQPVLGAGGPITVPPHDDVAIGEDGTVSIVPSGAAANMRANVGRLQVVSIPPDRVERGSDGLFRAADGFVPEPMAGKSLVPGALEASNVNATEALVSMIELSRKFEMQVRMMRTVEDNAKSGASLLRMG